MEWIKLGGKDRPIAFKTVMGFIYETKYKRSFQGDFMSLTLAQVALEAGDMENFGKATEGKTNIVTLANIVWAAFAAGCRRENLPVDFDEFDVLAWLDTDADKTALIIGGIYDSLPRDRDATKKKTMPRTGRRA